MLGAVQTNVLELPRPFPLRSVDGLPGDGARHQIRDTLAQLRDMHGFLQVRRERFGPNFAFAAFGFVVFAVGEPELVRAIHLDADDAYSSRLGWDYSIGELFKGGLMLRDFGEHRQHRSMVQAAFRPSAMQGYLEIIERCVTATLDDWQRQQTLQFYPAVKALGLRIALELILGVSADDRHASRIGRAFRSAVEASIALVRYPVWPLAYWQGLRGRRFLKEWLVGEVRRRRANPGADIFSRLCATELTDDDIADHLVFLIMAAHDTTASALTSCVWAACGHREWQARMRDEVQMHRGPLSLPDLETLQANDWVLKEALRLKPPGPFMMRRTTKATRLGRYDLPANLSIAPVSMITHFLPDMWTEPERFDPERFAPSRAEHRQHAGLYYPFGGGAHHCLGIHLAYMQAKTFLFHFWRRFGVAAASERPPRFRSIPIPYPVDGLPVRLSS